MFCNASKLDNQKLDAIKALEQELGKTLVAYSCSNPEPSILSDAELMKIKSLEEKLAVTLVAFK
ncbi:hypothetical protein [Desulfoluna spongiiphila]|uniref:Uncharacterized protein n=1 Tax=Desulfoluna spongiiphila TaxID=419481 RepID=A0A1G5IE34_9BACT|nr:hypothetical protein [Desulfoluna spongiiphila]SCY74031.1 hypothetical protein SAMN05216233_11941 [Desulfoluna spongiiphila]VVS95394.1 hypothetical protein DBB_49710 [Desulfoluna spongiiphila]